MSRMTDREIKCPCGYREYMEEHNCEKTDCNKCCPLSLQETITHQQAEIERLQADKEALINGQETLQKEIERLQSKTEAQSKTITALIAEYENLCNGG